MIEVVHVLAFEALNVAFVVVALEPVVHALPSVAAAFAGVPYVEVVAAAFADVLAFVVASAGVPYAAVVAFPAFADDLAFVAVVFPAFAGVLAFAVASVDVVAVLADDPASVAALVDAQSWCRE